MECWRAILTKVPMGRIHYDNSARTGIIDVSGNYEGMLRDNYRASSDIGPSENRKSVAKNRNKIEIGILVLIVLLLCWPPYRPH